MEVVKAQQPNLDPDLFEEHEIEEYEISVTGATGLPGSDGLRLGDEIELVVKGRVVRIEHEIRTRPEKLGGNEYAVRVAKIKARGVRVVMSPSR